MASEIFLPRSCSNRPAMIRRSRRICATRGSNVRSKSGELKNRNPRTKPADVLSSICTTIPTQYPYLKERQLEARSHERLWINEHHRQRGRSACVENRTSAIAQAYPQVHRQ